MNLSEYGELLAQGSHGVVAVDAAGTVGWFSPLLAELMGQRDLEGVNFWQSLGTAGPVEALEYVTPGRRRRHFTLRHLGGAEPWRWLAVEDTTCRERSNLRHRALLEVASSLSYAATMEETLNEVSAAVVRATRAEACSIWLFEGDQVRKVGYAGLPQNYYRAILTLMKAGRRTPAVEAFEQRRIVIFPRAARVAEILADPELADAHDYFRECTWSIVACVPLLYQGEALGTLNCFYGEELEEPEEESKFLQAVADQAAVSVENARLVCELKGKAVLEERQRIARELHDSVNQALYGISLGAHAALNQLSAGNGEAARQALQYLVSLSEAGLVEMRSLICELRPEALENEGLVALVHRQLSSLQARHGVLVESTLLEPQLSLEAKHALYRVIQEALANVARHAQAERAELRMEVSGGQVRVNLLDNGVGFDPAGSFPGHFGLKTMQERIATYGGHFEVVSAPGQGTRVKIDIPVVEYQLT